MGSLGNDDQRSRTVLMIATMVANQFGLPISVVIGGRRTKQACLARHITMYLARTATGRSYPELARDMMLKDHTTVIHGVNRIQRLLGSREDVQAVVDAVAKRLSPTIDVLPPNDPAFGRLA